MQAKQSILNIQGCPQLSRKTFVQMWPILIHFRDIKWVIVATLKTNNFKYSLADPYSGYLTN